MNELTFFWWLQFGARVTRERRGLIEQIGRDNSRSARCTMSKNSRVRRKLRTDSRSAAGTRSHAISERTAINSRGPALHVSLNAPTAVDKHCSGDFPNTQEYNTYVTLKLQNVKSSTVPLKGSNPCWEQDFLFETNDLKGGLLLEVSLKGMLWDRTIGYYFLSLMEIAQSGENCLLDFKISCSKLMDY
uniref:C2 domain-containing protein n=1 Tax=Trichogramma kaykai TaxID=54128 RepID=A0ABD2XR56_9HYME